MNAPNRLYGRAPQILSILADQGPLSVRGLSAILEPEIKRRQLRKALCRLHARRFIEKQYSGQFRGVAVFYRITQNKKYWPEIAIRINRKPRSLFQLQFRPVEYIHSEACAMWAHHFESIFQDGIALRDFAVYSSGIAKELILAFDTAPELLPDILFVLPSQDGSRLVSIAVEVERYVKSDERTLMKLKKFAIESRLDGVIWLCDGDGIASRLSHLYNTRVRPHAIRIRNYGDNFMLFQSDQLYSLNPTLNLKNAGDKHVDICAWMSTLSTVGLLKRKDSSFAV